MTEKELRQKQENEILQELTEKNTGYSCVIERKQTDQPGNADGIGGELDGSFCILSMQDVRRYEKRFGLYSGQSIYPYWDNDEISSTRGCCILQ